MEKLREKYLAGNITREEYLMQMFRLRLRYREEIHKLITLEKEIQKLNKKISEENKELAKNLIAINKDFAEQMKEIHDDVNQLIDATKNMKRGVGKP
jgi:molecular chaperone DnaK (HSP70)